MEELQLPMRRNTLDPHAMVAELPEAARSRLVDHFAASVSFSPELKAVAEHILQHAPRLLRAKELLETVEAFKQIANFAADASKARGGVPLARAYDVACGHGLLGCLLAYRFPKAKITCCDTAPMRPALQAYIAAFEACGIRSFEGEAVLGNLEFVQGELAKVVQERELEADSSQLAMVAAVHACNSAAPEAIAAAEAAGAVWCVMPCCIPDGTYFPCAIRGSASGDDTVRYLLQCGAIAGQHRAERVNAIDSRITNRNFLLCGGAGWADNEERKLSCTGPSPQPSGKK
ncbi:unnamed protein product [Polarella glacialis]|nr:unnamed protein product [Polarella glacialis]